MASSSSVEIDPDLLRTLATKSDLAPLATREEMHATVAAAVAPLATREEMHTAIAAAVAPSATRDEMHAAIAAAVAPLATRDEMHTAIAAAIAPLATREELNAAIAPLATREELNNAIAPLATREEMRAEIREEGERTRRYFDVVAERLETSINLIAEGHTHLDAKIDAVRTDLKADVADLDRRVTRLEARRRSR